MKKVAWSLVALAPALACGDPPRPEAPPCDQACQDGVALRGLRETLKLAFNLTLQGKPVGAHDETIPCVQGGSVRVTGTATSNALQGSTEVDLTYVLTTCKVIERDEEGPENYELTFDGTVTQRGTLAVQPTATTAILLRSDAVSLSGRVYAPAIPYEAVSCALDLAQNGNDVGGLLCGRPAGFRF